MKYIAIIALLMMQQMFCLYGQSKSDTLSLDEAIERVISTYPSVAQAQDKIADADIKKKISESVYLPLISGTASYMWLDPISELTLDGGTVHIQSHHNATFGVSVTQLLWDFGKSRPKIEMARMEKLVAELQREQLLQDLALQTIRTYCMTIYARRSVLVKERQMYDFAQMLSQTAVKRESGSATNFDYLNTSAGYNSIKTELIALNTSKQKQYVNLSILADTTVTDRTMLMLPTSDMSDGRTLDELIAFALQNRTDIKIMNTEYEIALQQKKVSDRISNPTLNAGASAGAKNGYEPDINDIRFNYSAGATLNVPIFDQGRRSQQRSLSNVGINRALSAIQLADKEITNQVADAYLSLVSSKARIEQLRILNDVSEKAYNQARINYDSGAITNLELLTSSTNAVNSELNLLYEEINCRIAYCRLMQAIGINLY